MEEKLCFKIDSEWLCNFVRQRVYYEGLSFQVGIEQLKLSFGIDDTVALQILTGTKKVVGVNGGELTDDDKSKEYLDYVQREEIKRKESKLQRDLELHPLNYIDPFATVRSIKAFKRKWETDIPTYDDLCDWFIYGSATMDNLMQGGLYSLSTVFVKDIIKSKEDQEVFYEQLYNYWQERLQKDHFTKQEIEHIKIRQKKYEIYKYRSEEGLQKDLDFWVFDTSDNSEKFANDSRDQEKAESEKGIYWALDEDDCYTLCYGQESYYQRQGTYIPCRAGVFSKYGLISPDGEFYACDFASHAFAAYVLLHNGPREDLSELEDYSKAKDELFNRGWCFVNTAGQYRFYSKYGTELEDFPQKMMDIAYDYLVWERSESA